MSTPTADQIVAVATVDLLVAGGVTEWEWYDDSIAGYEESADVFVDAENFLNALQSGGVDNWMGYDDSISGLSDYADYVEGLEDLSAVLPFYDWKDAQDVAASQEVEPAAAEQSQEATAPVLRAPDGETEHRLYDYISERYGASDAATVFHDVVQNGFWGRNTFPKQFDKAIKTLVKGATLETPRKVLFDAVVKSGAINPVLDQLKEKKSV